MPTCGETIIKILEAQKTQVRNLRDRESDRPLVSCMSPISQFFNGRD
jgi:hypothetical protein